MEQFDPGTVFRIIDVVGVTANGILGGAVARAKGFDIVGFVVLSIASGLGGGVLRDVLLQWIAPGPVEGLIRLGGWSHASTEEVSG